MKIPSLWLSVAIFAVSAVSQVHSTRAPFALTLSVEGEFIHGREPSEGSRVVKTGSNLYLSITKTNTSKHALACGTVTNQMTGLDPAYEFDVRDGKGNPVARHALDHPELASGSIQGIGCEFKPGESVTSRGNLISRLFDLSHPGIYTIQVSQPVADKTGAVVVKSNIVTITVTDDDSLVEKATPPFTLRIAGYADGVFGEQDRLLAHAGDEIGINIEKMNTSKSAQDCSSAWSNLSGLDEKYQYYVLDSSGRPASKRSIDSSMAFTRGPGMKSCQPGEVGGSSNITISRLYDLTRPGKYTIQISQPVSDNPANGVVKSNTIMVTIAP
jgi:hypothetical protein